MSIQYVSADLIHFLQKAEAFQYLLALDYVTGMARKSASVRPCSTMTKPSLTRPTIYILSGEVLNRSLRDDHIFPTQSSALSYFTSVNISPLNTINSCLLLFTITPAAPIVL